MEAQPYVDISNGFVQLTKHIGTTAFKISKPFKAIRKKEKSSSAYITMPTCLFEVVVGNYSSNLSALEHIFYVIVLTHYQLNKARAVEISAEVWAKHLGIIDYDAAQLRSKILRVQRSLECTRTKLFVPIKYNYLKQIFKDIFRSHSCKLFLLCSYISVYKNYQTTGKLFCATINPRRTLKSYYPLSQVEVDSMNKKSHKEFSLNFVNQLLLKLVSRYLHKIFPTWYHFNSYMTQDFKYELHQSINVNRQSFRFSCNIANESSYTDDHKIELYLSQIDHVFQQNHYSSINQKRGGRYV